MEIILSVSQLGQTTNCKFKFCLDEWSSAICLLSSVNKSTANTCITQEDTSSYTLLDFALQKKLPCVYKRVNKLKKACFLASCYMMQMMQPNYGHVIKVHQ